MNAQYLGDGLYADFDGRQVELYAHNGITKTNAVFLDAGVLAAFQRYLKDLDLTVKGEEPS